MRGEIHELKCAEKKLNEKTKDLEKKTIQLQIELESRSDVLEDLQQYSRRNCLIVSGVPERRNEKTDDLIKNVATKVGVEVQDQDIDRSHRLGAPKPGRPRPIIVKFTRYNKRSELIKSIGNFIIKKVKSEIIKPLTQIFNLSLSSGIVPEKLKVAKVIPIYKKGDSGLFSNYRPVSLLPCFSKILERLVFNRCIDYTSRNS